MTTPGASPALTLIVHRAVTLAQREAISLPAALDLLAATCERSALGHGPNDLTDHLHAQARHARELARMIASLTTP